MTTIQFLAEWALRSSILILSGSLLLWALRVKDPSIRLMAWTAMLCGSLAIPAITVAMPKVPLAIMRVATQPVEVPAVLQEAMPAQEPTVFRPAVNSARPFDWALTALIVYVLIAGSLLLRLGFGLAISRRLLRDSRTTGHASEGIAIRESDRVASPIALGIVRTSILLPIDWREWDAAKLDAVLAHERSHIRRRDPAVQLLSAIHRALLWHSPLSWFLHRRIVRVAEEASDAAAVAAINDRASYAGILLDFMQRGVARPSLHGVPMARYGQPDERIRRILEGTALSRGLTRWSIASILALGAPLAYLAAARPQSAPRPQSGATAAAPAPAALVQTFAVQAVAPSAPPVKREPTPVYQTGLGNVTADTVTVKSQVDGQLMSVSFKEGDLVQAGQLLASIDPRPYEVQLVQAEGQLARDQAQLGNASTQLQRLRQLLAQNAIPNENLDMQTATVAQLEGSVRTDQAKIDSAKLQLNYTRVTAPISGVTGLLLVDPGNIVHAADTTGIVIINQLQPISVLFEIPEDRLPQVRALLREGANPMVEAWNRDNSVKVATGRLTAVDNQIDQTTGTAKLKAVFDNKDGALFPNEFVIVHLMVNAK